ncbi:MULTISPECIES: hypothetical protein [unclassified Streptomyces]|uniref:hypothetical protein n=1 Tax=unclassified Streptomyces TaxID=2593676 RepID=UPI0035E39FFB
MGAVDGSALVSARTVPESVDDPQLRKQKKVAIVIGGVSVALALAVGLRGEWLGAFMTLLVAPFGLGLTAIGVVTFGLVYGQWHLPRHGITVETEKVAEYTYNGTAS